MSRALPEWVGKDDDAILPPRVRIRIFDDHKGRCYICTAKIHPGAYWQADHVTALITGGENRESNIAPACKNCCYSKTSDDMAEKSDIATMRKKHVLPKKRIKSKFKRKVDGSVVLR